MAGPPESFAVPATVAVLAVRERARTLVRTAFPRRRCRLILTRTAEDLRAAVRGTLVDAALLDVGAPNEEVWRAVDDVRDFPSIPFFALTPMRPSDAVTVARCAQGECADILVDGVDDVVIRALVLSRGYSARFVDALRSPPAVLRLTSELQLAAWQVLIAYGGRPVRTDTLAAALGVSREHLSRAFGTGGTANLKRLIDFVRLASAAELSKNPGFDVGDVARVLAFASSSHLSTTAQRIVGIRPASLARLRTVDLVERFVHGRTRSRS
jgi:AraC-like DNA-binding protein